ncbi:heparin lyase I family protein [Pseudoduganella sp. LjRoot289]|uniref:heparin lyase I family protein n=1 Tax=Pseudoduganella sp. LjRoot289 TaxID=3342314 RepID=UPI003ECF1666
MRFTKLSFLILSSLACGAAWSQIDTTLGGTVSYADFGTRYVLSTAYVGNLTWDRDPAGSGRVVLRSRVRATDAKVGGVQRTDFLPKGEASQTGIRWYGLSVYFPTNWTVHPNPVVVAQVDQQQPTGLPPPLAIVVRGSALEMNLAYNHRPLSGTGDIATAANTAIKVFKLGPLQTGKWYCFAVRSEWSPVLGSGSLIVYQNRDKVFEGQRDINSYPGAGGSVPRVGQMYPGLVGVAERNVYTDFIRLGGPTTTLEQILGETPCKTTTATTALVK